MAAPNVDEIRKRLAKIKAQAFQALDLASNQPNWPFFIQLGKLDLLVSYVASAFWIR